MYVYIIKLQEKMLENIKWKKLKWLYKNKNQLRPELRFKKKNQQHNMLDFFIHTNIGT